MHRWLAQLSRDKASIDSTLEAMRDILLLFMRRFIVYLLSLLLRLFFLFLIALSFFLYFLFFISFFSFPFYTPSLSLSCIVFAAGVGYEQPGGYDH